MADPVLPNAIRVQSIFEGPSGLPEDVYVNSLVFSRAGTTEPTEATWDGMADVFDTFWNEPPASPATQPLRSYLASHLVNVCILKMYWLGDPVDGRFPHVREVPVTMSDGNAAVPNEVSLCSSYYATINQPRFRGRFYLGPFNTDALGGTGTGGEGTVGPARPATGLINSLVGATKRLADVGSTEFGLSVLSGSDSVARRVTNGWVDNEWDTQRRRGVNASLRSTWIQEAGD